MPPETEARLHFVDLFSGDCPPGQVIGTPTAHGVTRRGIDLEGVLCIDHQALRIRPLIQPGWGRAGLAYGPYPRENGLMFAAVVLNGNNTSQTGPHTSSVLSRMRRWLVGSMAEPLGERPFRLLRSQRTHRLMDELRQWSATAQRQASPPIHENLAVGWFPSEAPANPLENSSAFIVHALGPQNGQLWARSGSAPLPLIDGLPNVPFWYIIILREHGAAYYATSLPGVPGLAPYPLMRPLGIDAFQDETVLYAGIQQSVLGQVGFQVDTRVYGAQVGRLADYACWYGSAHAADRLDGEGALEIQSPESVGHWEVLQGSFQRTSAGLAVQEEPNSGDNLAILNPGQPSGLIHVLFACEHEHPGLGGLLWRFQNLENHWRVGIDQNGAFLERVEQGVRNRVAQQTDARLLPGVVNSLQILDDGQTFSFGLNGSRLFNTAFKETWLSEMSTVGLLVPASQTALRVRQFEAHPRAVPLPPEVQIPRPWPIPETRLVDEDPFDGQLGELEGRLTRSQQRLWRRELGSGTIEVLPEGAAWVRASTQSPNRGRTAYTIDWDEPGLADLSLEVTPPGTGHEQGERSRAGLIFWQDPDNYLIVNTWLDDLYPFATVSSFFYLDGFEDIYEAVWTSVGMRLFWGQPARLRTVFDGQNYLAFLNDEPVLFRSLVDVYPAAKRLSIQRVGIAINWEWGNDTGSILRHFRASR